MEQLDALRDLLAHQLSGGGYGEVMEKITQIAIQKLDPAQKKVRGNSKPILDETRMDSAQTGSIKSASENSTSTAFPLHHAPGPCFRTVGYLAPARYSAPKLIPTPIENSRYIPSTVKKQLWLNAKGHCQYRDPLTGHRCTSG